jgi:hypothetical protein
MAWRDVGYCTAALAVLGLITAWSIAISALANEMRAARGLYVSECTGALHVERWLGLCARFAPASIAAPTCFYHYCFWPLDEAEMQTFLSCSNGTARWPCYSAAPLGTDSECRETVVLSRYAGTGPLVVCCFALIVSVLLLGLVASQAQRRRSTLYAMTPAEAKAILPRKRSWYSVS